MDRPTSPLSASASEMPDGSAPPSPAPSDAHASDVGLYARKKKTRKKRKVLPGDDAGGDEFSQRAKPGPKKKKRKVKIPTRRIPRSSRTNRRISGGINYWRHPIISILCPFPLSHIMFAVQEEKEDATVRKKPRKQVRKAQVVGTGAVEELSAAQLAANEQMRKVLEEDKYSAVGSIVDTDSDDEDTIHRGRGGRSMDRANILAATRKRLWMERMNTSGSAVVSSQDDENEGENDDAAALSSRPGRKKKKRRGGRRSKEAEALAASAIAGGGGANDVAGLEDVSSEIIAVDESRELAIDHDDVSIFGATTGSSNATWVECDKCKKVCGSYGYKNETRDLVSEHFSHIFPNFQYSGAVFVEWSMKRSFLRSGTAQ
jgi:hypothetical protein